MLEIVLLILKIAGIILVSVLGILIVATCLALFVPARYRGDFSVSDVENSVKKAVCVKLRATWLLRLVRVYVSYEETARVRVKLLFFTLIDTAKEKKAKKQKKRKKKEKTDKKAAEETAETEEMDETSQEEKKIPKSDSTKEDTVGKNTEKKSEKKSKKFQISNISQTIRNFCDKLKSIKERIEKIEGLWISDHMVKSRSLTGKQLRYLLKHTKPKNLEGYIRFGFDDPSATGYAMALYGILYPIWSPRLSVEPDFENKMLDTHILIKGKIRVWHFVKVILRMVLSRDVRQVVKEIKKKPGNL